jgi:hypothetical protein
MDRTISQHIEDNRNEIDGTNISSQRRRHLKDELKSLESYKANHPQNEYDPTPLELYCDANPEALECRVYED